jgi:hypothetical protein
MTSRTQADFRKLEDSIEFQRIRARINNTLNLPIDNLSKSSGAPTDPVRYVRSATEPKDDLVTIFKLMLDLGSPDYEHQLATFLHNGPPKMEYAYFEEEDRWEYHGKPDVKTPDEELIAAVVDRVKAQRETVDRDNANEGPRPRKTLVIINKNPDKNFDFQCYTLDCDFVTDDKKLYERHVVTCHYGKGLCYPGRIDIKMRGWTEQGRKWEI